MIPIYTGQMPTQNSEFVARNKNVIALVYSAFQFLQTLFNRTGAQSGIIDQVLSPVTGGGSTQAAAASLTKDYNKVTGGTAGVLVALQPGQRQIVKNVSGGNYNVFPASGYQIDSLGLNQPYPLGNTKSQYFWCSGPNQLESLQLG